MLAFHNDTKWFLIFSWKQPRRLQNGFDFQWNFNSVFIQIDITEAKLGLGLQNGFDFFGFMLDWALQNGVEFYLKNEQQFNNFMKYYKMVFKIFLWLDLGFTKWFWFISEKYDKVYKMVLFSLGKMFT